MQNRIILAPVADAAASSKFDVDDRYPVTVIYHAALGLSATQYGDLQISHNNGTTWQDLYEDGAQVRLNSTNCAVTIYGPGTYRVDKEATTNATGITISSKMF